MTGPPGMRSGSSTLDKQYTAEAPGEPWETYYARQILGHFRPSGS